ncbi:MAG TPA: hypothetical protein VH165_21575 [Kofleriaceae bacterium]|nr:hypothetical protein [Kofleriaceae bacterium]
MFPLFAASAPTPFSPPTPPTPGAPAADGSHWSYKNGASEIEISTTGNVTLDAGTDALYDLHGDGTLRVTEHTGKEQRELTAQRDAVVWKVNGSVRPFDAAGKQWLRGVIKARPVTPTPPPPPHK